MLCCGCNKLISSHETFLVLKIPTIANDGVKNILRFVCHDSSFCEETIRNEVSKFPPPNDTSTH